MNVLLTGCNGFIGYNLRRHLEKDGHTVFGIDSNLANNSSGLSSNPPPANFIEASIQDVNLADVFPGETFDFVLNFACPASPPLYQSMPMYTMDTCYAGTKNMLELARRHNAVFVQASTSEVYGDPTVNPQPETYHGNTNTMGPRSCYDEGKRIAETLCYEYKREFKVDTRVIRIFNTYGPYMSLDDGRVVTNFIKQALTGKPLTIYGLGDQTRSLCHIDDLIRGIFAVMRTPFDGAINLGNDHMVTIQTLAREVLMNTGEHVMLEFTPALQDDPKQRQPDLTRARTLLGYRPEIGLPLGISSLVNFWRRRLEK